jgi:CheY-like chemotaxis protein
LNLEDLSVLLVEDDTDFRARTLEMLEALGVRELMVASNAAQALELLARQSWDVLLCSHRIGLEDGVLRALRQVSPATRAVLITAYAPASRLVAQTLGATEVLQRPFSLALLELVLRRVAATFRGLRGEVQELSLIDILQMYHHGRQSIAVLLSGPISGRIRLLRGEIVHAEAEGLTGLPALSRLLGAKTGVMTTELTPRDTDATIHGSFQSVVLSAIAEYDEQKRNDLRTAGDFPEPGETPVDMAGTSPRLPSLDGSGSDLVFPDARVRPSPAPEQKRRRALMIPPIAAALVVLGIYLAFLPNGVESPSELPTSVVNRLTPAPSPSLAPQPAKGPPAARTFTLQIDSSPRDASVLENGVVLGQTPLTLELERDTLARGTRRFVLQRKGYAPYLLEQGDSANAVHASIALEPLPAAAGGEQPAPGAQPAPAPSAAPPPLDIRLRR